MRGAAKDILVIVDKDDSSYLRMVSAKTSNKMKGRLSYPIEKLRIGGVMSGTLIDDELWERVQPLLPVSRRRNSHPGRKRMDDRLVLAGILYVLKSGIPWERLPREMGYGSGMTCCRRLRDWKESGAWTRMHLILMNHLRDVEELDFSRVMDSKFLVRSTREMNQHEKLGCLPHRGGRT